MTLGSTITLIVAVTAVMISPPALADCLIVEAYVGQRPADADAILDPIKEPLKAAGCRDARDAIQDIEAISRPGRQVDPEIFKTYDHDVREGFQKYNDGDYAAAIEVLERLAALAEDNPATMVGQPGLRTSHRLALIGAAMAHRKLALKAESEADAAEALARRRPGKAPAELLDKASAARTRASAQMALAKELMSQVVRTFGTREIQRSEFGGETFDFYQRVRGELQAQGVVELEVELDDPSGVLYVNGEYVDVGKLKMTVLTGTIDILVRWGAGSNAVVRFYRRKLEHRGLFGIWSTRRFEEALHTGPDWCCILYPSVASQNVFLYYDIAHFGSSSKDRVVLLSIQPGNADHPRVVVGQVYGVGSSKVQRRARILLEPTLPDRRDRIEAGEYWGGQRDSAPEQRARAAAWARSVEASMPLKLALAGVGIASGLAGGYLLYRSPCGAGEVCSSAPALGGGALLVAAEVSLGAAIFLELRDRRRRSQVRDLLLALRHDTITLGWAGSY